MDRRPPDRRRPGGPPRPPETPGRPSGRPPHRRGPPDGGGAVLLWGVHAVEAALGNRARPVRRLYATKAGFERVSAAAGARGVPVSIVAEDDIARRLSREAVHQGLMLEAGPLPRAGLEAILDAKPGRRLAVVLDQVTDPHNLGAILRSAAAFGATAVVVQERHSPPLSGTVAKTASGALDRVPVAEVVNVSRALEELKDAGFLTLGFDEDGAYGLADADLTGDVALVMGAEGEGLRRLVRETCDRLVRLPTLPRLPSLNVSNAAAVALYEAARQRGAKA